MKTATFDGITRRAALKGGIGALATGLALGAAGRVSAQQASPVVIEAVRLRWTTWNEMCEFLGEIISPDNPGREVETFSDACGESGPYIELTIPTLEGDRVAKHGDWIIKGVNGEFYPCKDPIFRQTYEPVEAGA